MARMIPLRDGDSGDSARSRLERAERRAEIRAELQVLSAEIEASDRVVWTLRQRAKHFRLTEEYRTLLVAVLAVATVAAFALAMVLISRSDDPRHTPSRGAACSLRVCVKRGHVLSFEVVQTSGVAVQVAFQTSDSLADALDIPDGPF